MTKNPPSGVTAGDLVDIECSDLIAKTGQAVGRADGMVVYVLGPVPGERARVRIESVKAKYAVAELVEILRSSADRAEPFCTVFGTCGGCQVQHLAYPAQLRWKRGLIEHALRRLGGIQGARVGFPIGMDVPRAYRNKMALVVDHTDAKPAFGFYAARTHDIVPLETCPVVMPQLDRYIAGLTAAAQDAGTEAAFGDAHHVIARVGSASGEGVVAVTTEKASPPLAAAGAALAAHLPGVVGIANSFEPSSENAVMGRRLALIYGRAEMEEAIDGVRFRVSPASFFQVNSEMVGKIFAFMAPQLAGVRRLVDLYCGAGTFALFFAKRGVRVVGIEENPSAVREARSNALLNGVGEMTAFLAGRVDSVLRSRRAAETLQAADVAFLDPPRKGSDEATLDALLHAKPPHVWYLSCNPATLARDLAHLIAGGYRLGAVQPFDMFPQTGHIEALATLQRADVAPLDFELKEEGA